MKIAIITDTHFGARNDSIHFDTFFQKFYDEVFFPYLDAHEIKTIFHLGDVFDRRKYINFSVLRSCKAYFFEKLRERNIDMLVIPGNHDTYYKNTNEVNSLDLLLREYSNITILESPVRLPFGSKEYLFVPWICAGNEEQILQELETPADLCFGHFEIDGFDMFLGTKNHGGLNRTLLSKFEMVLTGHFHHRSTDDNIYYLGSPYGFTWSDHNDPRGFHILDTETHNLTFIENPNIIFHKIYYDDKKDQKLKASDYWKSCVKVVVVNKTNYVKFDKFIDGLYDNEVLELTIEDDLSEYDAAVNETDEVNIEDTLTMLSDFIDNIQSDKDKDKLKTLMRTLYVEAQNLDS